MRGVVVLHALMVGVTVTDTAPVFANASDGSGWVSPLSWVLQVMPLFFVIGGFAGRTSFLRAQQRGGTAAAFVAGRIHRPLLPALWTIAIAGAAVGMLVLSFGVGVHSPDLIANINPPTTRSAARGRDAHDAALAPARSPHRVEQTCGRHPFPRFRDAACHDDLSLAHAGAPRDGGHRRGVAQHGG